MPAELTVVGEYDKVKILALEGAKQSLKFVGFFTLVH